MGMLRNHFDRGVTIENDPSQLTRSRSVPTDQLGQLQSDRDSLCGSVSTALPLKEIFEQESPQQ